MTIALGINFGDYIFLASDSRVTSFNFDRTVENYEDDHKKIYRTKLGLITGAGSVPLLGSLQEKLTSSPECTKICDTNAILQAIKSVSINYRKAGWLTPDHDISRTGWILTYNGIIEHKHILRLAMVHPADAKVLSIIQLDRPAILWPAEADPEIAKVLSQHLERKIKPLKEFSSINESIQYHTAIIAVLIKDLHPYFPSISPYFQIGIHSCDGTAVSEIIKDNSPFSLTLQRE